VSKNVAGSGEDIMVVPADDPKQIAPLLTGPGNEAEGVFSPDGRWIAFMSDRSGRSEIYVVRFNGDKSPPALGGPPMQITSDGGVILPGGWRRDGKEIVFRSLNNQVMAVPVDARNDSVSVGRPVTLFRPTLDQGALAMTPAADRFVVVEYPYAAGQTIHMLTNWRERLDRTSGR
jgi:hypothetical protein